MRLKRLFGSLAGLCLFQSHGVCHIIFVDVADVLNGFLVDVLCGYHFHIAKPFVGIEAIGLGLFAQAYDSVLAGVVGGKGK
jgi:hypothetical protein